MTFKENQKYMGRFHSMNTSLVNRNGKQLWLPARMCALDVRRWTIPVTKHPSSETFQEKSSA